MSETSGVKVAVLMPSRGLIHSRTMESVDRNLTDYNYERFYSHDKGIPEAFNFLVEQAFSRGTFSHFWFVEEDVVVPERTLKKALALEAAVVYVDYPVGGKNFSTIREQAGEIFWGGMGCTLITRQVFEQMPKPWFVTDKSLDKDLKVIDTPCKYGGHDVWFGMKCRDLGIKKVKLEEVTCTHLRVPAMWNVRKEENYGFYAVEEHRVIENYQRY